MIQKYMLYFSKYFFIGHLPRTNWIIQDIKDHSFLSFVFYSFYHSFFLLFVYINLWGKLISVSLSLPCLSSICPRRVKFFKPFFLVKCVPVFYEIWVITLNYLCHTISVLLLVSAIRRKKCSIIFISFIAVFSITRSPVSNYRTNIRLLSL